MTRAYKPQYYVQKFTGSTNNNYTNIMSLNID